MIRMKLIFLALKYGILTLLKIIDVGFRDLGQVFGHGTDTARLVRCIRAKLKQFTILQDYLALA